jgi:hypothetical protein
MDIPMLNADIKKGLDVMLKNIVKGYVKKNQREDKDEI